LKNKVITSVDITTTAICQRPFLRVSPWQSINDGIEAMNEIKTKVLDDTFTTDLGGESRDFVESSSNTSLL
jgi:hypothetical protein